VTETAFHCDECGLDLTPTPAQIKAVERWGNPLPRPPCPNTPNGLHRVSREQLDRVYDARIAEEAQSR
jgi:hypothetical protein